jgi:hypothetical protein
MSATRFATITTEQQEQALEQREVLRFDRPHREQAQSGIGERVLDRDHTSDDEPEREEHDRERRQERVRHDVAPQDLSLPDALGSSSRDEVVVHHIDQGVAHDQCVLADEGDREDEPRECEVVEDIGHVAGPVRSAPGVEYPPAGKSEGNGPTPWANAISTRIQNQNSGIE